MDVLSEFYHMGIDWSWKALTAVIILSSFLVLAYVLRLFIKHVGDRGNEDRRYVFRLFSKFVGTGLIILGAITSLGTIGLDISAVVASLGLTGFALGFAFKDFLSNILAGILIMIHQPFRRGETITVAGKTGVVRAIELRYTTLEDENSRIVVPNASLLNSVVTVQRVKRTD